MTKNYFLLLLSIFFLVDIVLVVWFVVSKRPLLKSTGAKHFWWLEWVAAVIAIEGSCHTLKMSPFWFVVTVTLSGLAVWALTAGKVVIARLAYEQST